MLSGRHVLQLVIVGFAVLGFVFVPLGGRTALEHARIVLASDSAARISEGASVAFEAGKEHLLEDTDELGPPAGGEVGGVEDPNAPQPQAPEFGLSKGKPASSHANK